MCSPEREAFFPSGSSDKLTPTAPKARVFLDKMMEKVFCHIVFFYIVLHLSRSAYFCPSLRGPASIYVWRSQGACCHGWMGGLCWDPGGSSFFFVLNEVSQGIITEVVIILCSKIRKTCGGLTRREKVHNNNSLQSRLFEVRNKSILKKMGATNVISA